MPVSINGSGSITGVSSLTQLTKLGVTGILTATDFSGPSGGAADFPNGLTATTASFSSNLSVGGNLIVDGVLTYDDVTNIDSVGVVTARAGVKVPDSQKIFLGTDDDLQIYHTGGHGFIRNTTGQLSIRDDSEVNITDLSAGYIFKGTAGGSVELYHNTSKKFETTSTGILVTGDITPTGYIQIDDSSSGGNLYIGDSSDLKLFHNGTSSYIRSGASNAPIHFDNNSGVLGAKFIPAGAFELYHNGNKRVETTNTGASVTGNLNISGHTYLNDNRELIIGAGQDLKLYHNGSSNYIDNTSDLYVRVNGSETAIYATANGKVALNYDSSNRFETTTTGAKVTGALEVTQEYPSIRPTLDLNFAATKTLDRRITFTRDSIGTYVDDMGIVRTVSNNVPRFDHSGTGECLGLLIEESRTNLNLYSHLDGGNWTSQYATSNNNVWTTNVSGVTDPAGNNNAAELKCNGTAANWSYRSYYGSHSGGTTSGTFYTFSLFVKPNGLTTVKLGVDSAWAQGINTFTLTGNGSVTPAANTNATIKYVGNGWYRCSTSVALNQTASASVIYIDTPGDGTSGVYVWGAQFEEGTFPTSYLPTSGSTVTRAADLVKITGTNFTDFYNQNEGTFFIDSAVARGSAYQGYVGSTTNSTANGGPSYNFNSLMSDADNSDILLNIWDGTSGAQALIPIAHPTGNMKAAGAFKDNDFAISMNGSAVSTDTSGTIDTNQDQLWIGRRPYQNLGWLNNSIKRVVYYNKRLPNAQLQGLTQQ